MSFVGSNILAGASGQGGDSGYKIERSLRFNSADTAYLNRTPSAAGNRKTWTWSGWVKCTDLVAETFILAAGNNPSFQFYFASTVLYIQLTGAYLATAQVFRDPAAFYHFVLAFDTTQATAANRVKLYVNGSEVTTWTTDQRSSIAQNTDTAINSATQHNIGKQFVAAVYSNMMLAEVNFIDGQALTPTDFGEFDSNNVWQPKEFAGTYDHSVNYSSHVTATGTGQVSGIQSSHPIADLFDGSTSTYLATNGANIYSSPAILTITFPSGYQPTYNSSVVIEPYGGSSDTVQASINGGALQSVSTSGSWAQHTLATGSGTITEIKVTRQKPNTNGGAAEIRRIIVDGVILQDFGTNSFHLDFADNSTNAALGTDTSGNNNTWTVNNLAGPNIVPANYYNMVSPTPNTGNAFIASNVTPYINTSTWAITNVNWIGMSYYSAGAMTFTPTTSIPVTNSLIVYFGAWADSAYTTTLTITYTDSTTETGSFTSSPQNYMGMKTASNAAGKSIQSISVNASSYHSIGGIVVDGSILVNITTSQATDSFVDTPTNYGSDTGAGGEVRGNYATLNPLQNITGDTFSDGNLKVATHSSNYGTHTSTIATPLSGKWFAEIQVASSTAFSAVGLVAIDSNFTTTSWAGSLNGVTYYANNGYKYVDVSQSSYGATYNNGDVIGIAYDADNGTVAFYKNGVSQGTISSVPLRNYYFAGCDFSNSGSSTYIWNFGQRAWSYAPPSGYKALCTQNLPDALVEDGSKYFQARTRIGGGTTQSFTTLRPGFVWEKNRTDSGNYYIYDIVRGDNKYLDSQSTAQENTGSGAMAFSANSYAVNSSFDWPSNKAIIDWVWDAGSSNTSIAAGSLNSSLYNQSQTWSTYGSYSGSTSNTTGSGWQSAFDISPTTYTWSSGGSDLTFTSGIPYTSKVEIYGLKFTSSNEIRVNGSAISGFNIGTTDNYLGWVTALTGSGTLTSIGSTGFGLVARVRVDGKLLIDSGVTPPNVPTIASTVRANPSAGFSIVSYNSGSTNGDYTLGHGLNAPPQFIIHKSRSSSNWWVYHADVIDDMKKYLQLNSNTAVATNSGNMWGASAPTSNVFGISVGDLISQSQDAIAYCFAPVEGYSKFGSFSGNGTTDNVFVYTGFKVKFILFKYYTSLGDWLLLDTSRRPNGPTGGTLVANVPNAEDSYYGSGQVGFDFLSNGFKIRHNGSPAGDSGRSVLYAAFAEHPFKTSRAR